MEEISENFFLVCCVGVVGLCLVDLNVPLLGLLQSLEPLVVVEVLGCGNSLEH